MKPFLSATSYQGLEKGIENWKRIKACFIFHGQVTKASNLGDHAHEFNEIFLFLPNLYPLSNMNTHANLSLSDSHDTNTMDSKVVSLYYCLLVS